MIARVRPDCVHLCLPHDLHYPVAKDAVGLGCDVFTEKPLAVSMEQALLFAELEKAHPERKIGVCLQDRRNETTEALKAILDPGAYGRIVGARGIVPWYRDKSYYEIQPWRGMWDRAGSGTMMNQSIHTLDLLYYLCGPVKALHGTVAHLLDFGIEVEDTVTARLEFENGARGVFWATNANFDNESVQLVVATEKAPRFCRATGKLKKRLERKLTLMAQKGMIGVQMSTIVPAKIPNFDAFETMKKLTGIGYHCIEISQVPMTPENVAGFRRAIDELDMVVSSCTAAVAPMAPGMAGEFLSDPDDFKKIVADCKALDRDMLRVGMLPMDCIGSYEKAVGFSRQAEDLCLKLKDEGIDLYYHNHHVEFTKYNGEYLLDIIRANSPHLSFELDIHWIQRGGKDPVKVIKKYADSIRLLHLKDHRIAEVTKPDMSAPDGMQKFIQAFFNEPVRFAEVGEGSLPIKECIEAGLAVGAEYFLVEQDDCYGRDPFDSLKISHDNLVKLGFGGWF